MMNPEFMCRVLAILLLFAIGPMPVHAETEIYYVVSDHLGTPHLLVDENRHVVWQAEYDEFGKATILVEEEEFNLRFPGQYYDKETGLNYNYYRDYDSSTGRYYQSDPIGILKNYNDPTMKVAMEFGVPLNLSDSGSGSGGLNHLYGYVNQNPLRFFDFLGLEYSHWDGNLDYQVIKTPEPYVDNSSGDYGDGMHKELTLRLFQICKDGSQIELGQIRVFSPMSIGEALREYMDNNTPKKCECEK